MVLSCSDSSDQRNRWLFAVSFAIRLYLAFVSRRLFGCSFSVRGVHIRHTVQSTWVIADIQKRSGCVLVGQDPTLRDREQSQNIGYKVPTNQEGIRLC